MTLRHLPPAVLAAALLLVSAPAALAKGPIEARLDAGVSPDAQPGATVRIGFSLGFTEPNGSGGGTWYAVDGWSPFVRLLGSGGQTTAAALPDGQGHYTARVRIPQGGVSRIEIATRDGSGAEQVIPLADAAAAAVVGPDELEVSIRPLPPVSDPHATIDVYVRVVPKAGVVVGSRVLPSSLVVFARDLGTNLANYADAERVGPDLYRASLHLPGPGRVWIQAGTGTPANVTHVFGDMTEVRLGAPQIPAGAPNAQQPNDAAPTATMAPLGLVGVAIGGPALIALLLAAAAIRRPLRRREGS